MMNFEFCKNKESLGFCREILDILVKCAGRSSSEAANMLAEYWNDLDDVEDEFNLYSETPYYWAMCIAHHPTIGDNNPEWYKSAKYMPPPQWIREKYYNH